MRRRNAKNRTCHANYLMRTLTSIPCAGGAESETFPIEIDTLYSETPTNDYSFDRLAQASVCSATAGPQAGCPDATNPLITYERRPRTPRSKLRRETRSCSLRNLAQLFSRCSHVCIWAGEKCQFDSKGGQAGKPGTQDGVMDVGAGGIRTHPEANPSACLLSTRYRHRSRGADVPPLPPRRPIRPPGRGLLGAWARAC